LICPEVIQKLNHRQVNDILVQFAEFFILYCINPRPNTVIELFFGLIGMTCIDKFYQAAAMPAFFNGPKSPFIAPFSPGSFKNSG